MSVKVSGKWGESAGPRCGAQHFSNWKMLKGSFPWRPPIWLQTKQNSDLPVRAEVFILLVKGKRAEDEKMEVWNYARSIMGVGVSSAGVEGSGCPTGIQKVTSPTQPYRVPSLPLRGPGETSCNLQPLFFFFLLVLKTFSFSMLKGCFLSSSSSGV